jgi:thiamine pyrophosphate-dependent acetolactate synthase large subunit-like protein
MVYDISPKELIDIDTGRHAAIANAFVNLPDDAKATIKDLAKKLKKSQSPATKKESPAKKETPAKKPAGKSKGTKK